MVASPLSLLVLIGSTRPGRLGPTVAAWFTGRVEDREDLALSGFDLADVVLPSATFASAVDEADGVVVVTPEYNHSFPGPLKAAIDSLRNEWAAKPIAFVSYGGISGGLRAVEALRVVFAELHAITVRETVSFDLSDGDFRTDGRPADTEAADAAATRLLDQLVWWAEAARTARLRES